GSREYHRFGIRKLARFWLTVLLDWCRTAPSEQLDRLYQDLRYSATTLYRSKAFTLAAIACLSLGIGVSSTLFSAASTLLTRPLPVTDPDRVVMLRSSDGSDLRYDDYVRFRDSNQTLAGFTGWTPLPVSLGLGASSEVIVGEIVAGNYFDVLGASAALGRTFVP